MDGVLAVLFGGEERGWVGCPSVCVIVLFSRGSVQV
jgi:hypothetical protein